MTWFYTLLILYLFTGILLACYMFFIFRFSSEEIVKLHHESAIGGELGVEVARTLTKEDIDNFKSSKVAFDKRNKFLSFSCYVLFFPAMVVWFFGSYLISKIRGK